MLPIYSTYSFASSYLEPDAFEENIFGHRAQEDFDSYQSMPGGWCAPAHDYGVSPWAWQWSGEAAIQKPCAQLTYGVVLAPPTFSPVVGGPVSNPNEPRIACPRPIHPLSPPKWIYGENGSIPDEGEETSEMTSSSVDSDMGWQGEKEFDEEFDMTPRFLTSYSISPDADNLPPPYFPPSGSSPPMPSPDSPIFLSPDASELPEPHFDSDPPEFVDNSPQSVWGVDFQHSPPSGTLESMLSPDPEALPLPCFEMDDQPEAENPGHPDRHQNRVGERGVLYQIGDWAAVCGRFFQVEAEGSGGPATRRWLDWTRDKVPGSNIT